MIAQKTGTGSRQDPFRADIPEGLEDYVISARYRSETDDYEVEINWPKEINGIPQEITKFQGKVMLKILGKLEQVEQAISQSDNPMMLIAWVEIDTWRRQSNTIKGMAEIVGMTEEELDSFFVEAKKIEMD
ncbi:hypothetical protein [Pleomorphovibrio marinus]|uniref:hypothetical protein n=1 Tax=Pleomorphovibrio marinus TaxID=2164132 RepID=UPI000E0A4801|nr:hypothetical protein [Pleomorphovibrio marinus]